jgi:hypothetical protein
MRLWSLHPKYLDAKGLTALWREGLLAKKVLAGKTKGYKNHPQLIRFKKHINPAAAINSYLAEVFRESRRREYRFDPGKIKKANIGKKIPVTRGQAAYEMLHLKRKLKQRDYKAYLAVKKIKKPGVNNIFKLYDGGIEGWEKG